SHRVCMLVGLTGSVADLPRSSHGLPLISLDAPEPRGTVLGRGYLGLYLLEDLNRGDINVTVDHPYRRLGVGRRIADELLRIATLEGRTILDCWTQRNSAKLVAGPRLTAATGFGEWPANDPATAMLHGYDFTLEQIELMNELELPLAPGKLDPWLTVPAGYDVVQFTTVPDKFLHDVGALWGQMSDAPQSEVRYDDAEYTPERIRSDEAAAANLGFTHLRTAIRHCDSGQLVAFSGLGWFVERPHLIEQRETIVLPSHRGHGLGMLAKAVTLTTLAQQNPHTRRLITQNAAENTHMLRINRQIGFEAQGISGSWLRRG
ncbi:MAG: hypothetical protein ACRCWS_01875, partial [Propionibacteriaceae bacterium]